MVYPDSRVPGRARTELGQDAGSIRAWKARVRPRTNPSDGSQPQRRSAGCSYRLQPADSDQVRANPE